MLSRLLLIFGLLMLSWQWGQTMPRHEETTHKAVHEHTTARQLQDVHTTRKTILGRLTQKTSHGHTTTTPSSVQVTPTAIEEPIPGNFSGISTVSLFDVPPSCKPGHVPTGPNQRCRLEV
ncbi:uncharacterized protein LOC117583864 isoform X2 [Drosophila guanche]|uniref:uncharacterized protein LOC117583864 isoform X2 n=1 Tax=Drosophila guanche TaxID=7266 RepID=UPI001470D3A3|nr:uncharacterized protein LOC117583864 isoform X2 [Drosophila guanche]